jgi:NAD(P)-dependent dehydrogenase (short-subunit alcohol dehydrogenase family)
MLLLSKFSPPLFRKSPQQLSATARTISNAKKLEASEDLVLVDGDISKKDTAIKVVDAAIKHFKRIDLLVNNVGIYIPKPFTDYTPEDFELMIATNVGGYFFITQQAVPQMRKQKSGHIVGISTVLADQPLAGAPISLPVITKSTIPAFRRALAMEYVGNGIRANSISPGVVDTPMHANDNREELKKLSPTPRLVQISEIVDALFYLQSAPMGMAKTFDSMEERMPAPNGNMDVIRTLAGRPGQRFWPNGQRAI